MRALARVLTATTAVVALAGSLTGIRPARSGGAEPARSHHVVEIRQLRFQPPKLHVTPGDTVTWINRDIVPHTATAIDATWSSGELEEGGSWTWIVPADPTDTYYCEYHPGMRGALERQ
jgi:plastocyanin